MNTPCRSPRWLGKAALLAAFSLGSVALHAQEMVVSAAASLTNAFQAIGQAFEKTRPGVKAVSYTHLTLPTILRV